MQPARQHRSDPIAVAPPRTDPALWALLGSRLALFAAAQAVIAGCLAAAGIPGAWAASAGWWPLSAAAANLASIGLLALFTRREGVPLRTVFLPGSPGTFAGDVGWLLATMVVLGPVAQGPSWLLQQALWGGTDVAGGMMMRPIPPGAAWLGLVVFPVTVAFAELPTYFGLIRPRLEASGWSAPASVALAAAFLSLQHVTLPLIFDARFLVWRAVMFLGFAVLVGTVLRLRPRLLPWFMAMHGALDATAVWFVVAASV